MDSDDRIRDLLAKDTAELTYEQAREGLLLIVQRLEDGQVSLEDSLQLWEKGEELSRRCGEWLDNAQARIDAVIGAAGEAGTADAAAAPAPASTGTSTGNGNGNGEMPF